MSTLLRRAILVISAVAAVVAVALPASARPADQPVFTQYRAIHVRAQGDASGDWAHCFYVTKAPYTQTATCSKGHGVSETVSGGAGFSYSVISQSVGFSVTYSSSVSSSVSVSVKPGGSGWYDVGFRYRKYRALMQFRQCQRGTCGRWEGNTVVHVQKHLGDTYHYFGTGAA